MEQSADDEKCDEVAISVTPITMNNIKKDHSAAICPYYFNLVNLLFISSIQLSKLLKAVLYVKIYLQII